MSTEIKKIDNDRYTVNGKLLVKATDGNWIGYDEVTSQELAIFYKHLDCEEKHYARKLKVQKLKTKYNLSKPQIRLVFGLIVILIGVITLLLKSSNPDIIFVSIGAVLILLGVKNTWFAFLESLDK